MKCMSFSVCRANKLHCSSGVRVGASSAAGVVPNSVSKICNLLSCCYACTAMGPRLLAGMGGASRALLYLACCLTASATQHPEVRGTRATMADLASRRAALLSVGSEHGLPSAELARAIRHQRQAIRIANRAADWNKLGELQLMNGDPSKAAFDSFMHAV